MPGKRWRSLPLCLLLTVAITASGQRHHCHALLIGVDHYKHIDSIGELAVNIAAASREFRADRRHFSVDSLLNESVTPGNIKLSLQRLAVAPGDYVFVYLTGHGVQVQDKSGNKMSGMEDVYICYDAPGDQNDPGFMDKVLRGDSLGSWLMALRRRLGNDGQVFVLAECCNSGAIDRGDPKSFGLQSHFIREQVHDLQDLAPLVVFSSSRAFDLSDAGKRFTLLFMPEFKRFSSGSYYDLFRRFYQIQQRAHTLTDDIENGVNLDVDDAAYLRLGVFEDKVYPVNNFGQVIGVSPVFKKNHLLEINLGIFDGVTPATVIIVTEKALVCRGKVSLVKNASAVVRMDHACPGFANDALRTADVRVEAYHFNDSLFIAIDKSVPDSIQKDVALACQGLNFVRLKNDSLRGYRIVYVPNKGVYMLRSRDGVGLYKLADTRSTLLRMQICRFIRGLTTTRDTMVGFAVGKNGRATVDEPVVMVKPNDTLSVYVHSAQLAASEFYCILQIEDEFIKQLAPVNFQVNDGECALSVGSDHQIFIGKIAVGRLDGKLLLITSDNPIDLREVLLKPVGLQNRSDKKHPPSQLEKMIDELFLNKGDHQTLYSAASVTATEFEYKVTL